MSDGEEEHHEEENFEAEDQIVGLPLTKGFFSIFVKIAKLSEIVDLLAKGLSRLERVGNGSDFAYVKFNGSQVRSFLSINQIMVFSTN